MIYIYSTFGIYIYNDNTIFMNSITKVTFENIHGRAQRFNIAGYMYLAFNITVLKHTTEQAVP